MHRVLAAAKVAWMLCGTPGVRATTRGTRSAFRIGRLSEGAFIAMLVVVGIMLAALVGIGIYSYMEYLRKKEQERRYMAGIATGVPVTSSAPVPESVPD